MANNPKGLVSQSTVMLPLELKHFKISQFCKDGSQFTFEERHHHYTKLEAIFHIVLDKVM